MPLCNIQMQILSSMSRIPPYMEGPWGGGTRIINFVELTKAVKMLPDFRSENLSTTKTTWTGLVSN